MADGPSPSPAFVRAPEGGGCAERFIRTLNENLFWFRRFRTVGELRLALVDLRRTCDENRRIEPNGRRSPARFRGDRTDMLPTAPQSKAGVSGTGGVSRTLRPAIPDVGRAPPSGMARGAFRPHPALGRHPPAPEVECDPGRGPRT